MHLVEIGHGAVAFGDIADLGDGGDVAVHRIDALEGDELGHGGIERGELLSRSAGSLWRHSTFCAREWRMPSIIEAWFISSERTTQPGMRDGERAERRPVRHVAGGEEQRRLLAVQVGQLALQLHMVVVGAGNVARAAGAGAAAVDRLVHRRKHLRVLAHAEIVVGAPHGDVVDAAVAMAGRRRERRRAGVPDRRRRDSCLRGEGRRAHHRKMLQSPSCPPLSTVFCFIAPARPARGRRRPASARCPSPSATARCRRPA